MTVVSATVIFFLIAEFPGESKWLSDDEKALVVARLTEGMDRPQLGTQPTWRDVLSVLADFKIILGGLMYFGLIVSGFSYAYFAPIILQSFGYSPVKTQLYSVPPWAAAFVLSMLVATASDHYRRKYIFVLPTLFISIIGITVLLNVHDSVNVRYGALFLVAIGGYAAAPIVVCWFSTNREPA